MHRLCAAATSSKAGKEQRSTMPLRINHKEIKMVKAKKVVKIEGEAAFDKAMRKKEAQSENGGTPKKRKSITIDQLGETDVGKANAASWKKENGGPVAKAKKKAAKKK